MMTHEDLGDDSGLAEGLEEETEEAGDENESGDLKEDKGE